MGKLEQALILHPANELTFKDETTSHLKLTNPTENYICFKLKTTAPRMYCVRPNSGVIAPQESLTVAVMMQLQYFDNADKVKHKFMVQSLFAPSADVDQDQLFKDALPENFMNSKLRCVFDDPALNNSKGENASGDGSILNTSDMKVDASMEQAATSAVQQSSSDNVSLEDEILKAMEESKKLKALAASLRQENSQLKEESLRSRVTKNLGSASEASTSSKPTHQFIINEESKPFISTQLIVISIFVFIIGIIIGHLQA